MTPRRCCPELVDEAGVLRAAPEIEPQRVFFLQHVGEADDGVERRTQFMAHGGEEAALGGVCPLGLGAGVFERQLLAFALGYVAEHCHDFAPALTRKLRARRPLERPAAHFDPDELHGGGAAGVGCLAPNAKLDGAVLTQRRGIAERRQIRRAIGHVNAVEQAVRVQIADPAAEQRFGGGRREQHRAVAAVPRDHVRHVARQQPVAILFGVQQPETGAGQRLGPERETGCVQCGGNDTECRQCRRTCQRRRQQFEFADHDEQACRGKRKRRRQRHDTARRRQRGFQRHHNEPDRGERCDAPGEDSDHRDQTGQRQRRQNVGAFVAAGAGEKIRGEDRRDEPGKRDQFKYGRRAAHDQINRKRRQRDDAAEQTRRNKRAMTRRSERILLRRGVHQRFDIVPYRREEGHFPIARPALQTRSPLFCCGIVSDGT